MDVMLDLETMGTTQRAAIVSVGAVRFDPAERFIQREGGFYRQVDLASSVEAGLEMDASTVLWWMQQSDEARREVTHGGRTLYKVLSDFAAWYWFGGAVRRVWAHSSENEFDIAIMENAMAVVGMPMLWTYRDAQGTRALFDIAGVDYRGTAHHALQDAIAQAEAVIKAYDILGNRKEGGPQGREYW